MSCISRFFSKWHCCEDDATEEPTGRSNDRLDTSPAAAGTGSDEESIQSPPFTNRALLNCQFICVGCKKVIFAGGDPVYLSGSQHNDGKYHRDCYATWSVENQRGFSAGNYTVKELSNMPQNSRPVRRKSE